jgi:hypothetical protein
VSVEGSDPGASMESLVWTSDGVILTGLSNSSDGSARANEVLIARLSAA